VPLTLPLINATVDPEALKLIIICPVAVWYTGFLFSTPLELYVATLPKETDVPLIVPTTAFPLLPSPASSKVITDLLLTGSKSACIFTV